MPNDEVLDPGQPAQKLELGTPHGNQGGDPLDEIQDISALKYIASTLPAFSNEHKGELEAMTDRDEVLGQVKKIRGISSRIQRKHSNAQVLPAPATEPIAQPPQQEFLTKADFHKSNERKAVREATADPEVKANWDKIVAFYTPRRGKETPEDIKEDIQDAVTLFNARNAKGEKDDSAAQLSTTTVIKTGGGAPTKATPQAPALPNLRTPAQPKDWYPKKT